MSRETRPCEQTYLFDSLDSKVPSSARKVHVRRLADILQLSIHRRDWPRAKRAWSILTRCPEFEWKNMWQTGLLLIQCTDDAAQPSGGKCLEYLRLMMLQLPENRVAILQEIILWLIKRGRHQHAWEELELYLPLSPFQDSAVLQIYAGLLCLFLAYPQCPEGKFAQHELATSLSPGAMPLNQAYVLDCKRRLRRAANLDPEHPVPPQVLLRLDTLNTEGQEVENESDDASDVLDEDDTMRPTKRTR